MISIPVNNLRFYQATSPPLGYAAISKGVIKSGVGIPLHPLVNDMLAHFGIASLQLTPNSFRNVIAIYITCMENGLGEFTIEEMAHIFT